MSAILDFGISTPTMHRKNGGNSFEQPDRSSIGYWASVRLFKGISPILEWSITHKRPLCVIFDVKRSVMGNHRKTDQPRSQGLSLVVFHRH